MKIITPRVAELDERESVAYQAFKLSLEGGHSIASAAAAARRTYPGLDEKFYEWLER